MRPASAVLLVAQREAGDRLRNKAFVWGTLVTLALILGVIVIPTLVGGDGPDRYRLGVVGDVPDAFEAAVSAELAGDDAEVELVELADRDEAARAVEDGDVDAALLDGAQLMADGPPDPALRRSADDALGQLAMSAELERVGVSEEELAAVLGAHEPLTVVDTAGEEDEGEVGFLVAFAATILLFVAVQINGSSLLTGAIEEKSSRVVEVLLGAVRPWQLLFAKLAALTTLALAQLGLFVGGGLGANAIVDAFEVPPATGRVVAVSLLMVVIGFAFYAALFTVAGSMASSIEDAQAAAGPLQFFVVGAYMVAIFFVIPSPGGGVAQVLTYLPPTAPFVLPARVALESVAAWEIAVAALITLVGAVVTIRLAARLYSAALLSGGKLTWRDAWQAEPIR